MAELNLEQLEKLDLSTPHGQNALAGMINEVYKGSQPYLERLGYVWDQNIRFYEGEQHIYFNETTRRFEVIPITRYNKFIPRPTTNYILPICQTMTSVLAKNKPTAYITPNSHDEMDMAAAKLCERVQEAKWEMDDEQMKLIDAIKISMMCGTVARKDYWDVTKGPLVNVKDEMGNVLFSGKAGDTNVNILSPFNFIPDLQNKVYYIETSVQGLSWIRQNYGKNAPGYTGNAFKVKEDKNLNIMLDLQNRLKTSSGIAYAGYTPSNSGATMTNCAVVKEAYIAPTEKFPEGLLVVVGGNELLYIGPSPYYDPRYEESWHPYTFWKWEEVFFRWHGLSLVEQLVPLQRRINAIDSMIILNRMTMAMPQWILPSGHGIPEGYISGEPGLCITATPVGSNGMLPQKIEGVGLPADVYKERKDCWESMQAIARLNEVLSGRQPSGVNTATGLNMLLEQSYSGLSTNVIGLERFIEQGQMKKLRLIANRYKEPREELVAKMQELNKDNLDVEIKAFLGVDLRDNTSVKIETGSSLPKLKSAQQEVYAMLADKGLFGPIDPITNPIGNEEFLKIFGVQKISSEKNADVVRARWVNSVLTGINRGQMEPQAYPMLQDFEKTTETLEIYLKVLTDRMKAPTFKDEQHMFSNRRMEIMMALQELEIAKQTVLGPQMAMPNAIPAQGIEQNSSVMQPSPALTGSAPVLESGFA